VIYPDGVETAIVRVDQAAIPTFIDGVLGRSPDLSKVVPAAPSTVTVDVLNGAGISRLAARNAGQLGRLGFHINLIDSAPSPVTETAVEYPQHRAAQAKAVANLVPGAKLMQTSSVPRVTLVLGTDGRQVTGLTAPKPNPHPKHRKKAARANGMGCIN
jgi:hypothetical protein